MNNPIENPNLGNKGVLITRAIAQAEPYAKAVSEAGGLPVLLPGIQIEPQTPVYPGDEADWIIFISPNAVRYGLPAVQHLIDNGSQVAAIGPSTARELSQLDIAQPLRARDGFDSEALLKLNVFQRIAGKRVVIVRGVGGRALLPETLRKRGAEVALAETYRRDRPTLNREQVQYLEDRWAKGAISVVTCLSVATLDNVLTTLTTRGQRMLMVTPLLSPSERVLERAATLGHQGLRRQASGPEVGDIVESLIAMVTDNEI
ncbi:MAG: uroporphyrinogen-III synthase [Pseudomonadota bacterium]